MFKSYKEKFACFNCRVCFKGFNHTETVKNCPNCGNLMEAMGKDFQAPKKNNNMQWKKLEVLLASGIKFVGSCGCNGPGPRPKTYAETKRNQSKNQYGSKAFQKKYGVSL